MNRKLKYYYKNKDKLNKSRTERRRLGHKSRTLEVSRTSDSKVIWLDKSIDDKVDLGGLEFFSR